MINSIKTFLADCPFLSGIDLNINYLGENTADGAVESIAAEPVIKHYTDGASLRQYLFAISLRRTYGQAAEINNAAISLSEQIADWIEQQDRRGILPNLGNGKNAISLEVLKTSQPEEKTADSAVYRLQCRLVYCQD